MKNKKHKYLMPFALAASLIAIAILILITGLYHKQSEIIGQNTTTVKLSQAYVTLMTLPAIKIIQTQQVAFWISFWTSFRFQVLSHELQE